MNNKRLVTFFGVLIILSVLITAFQVHEAKCQEPLDEPLPPLVADFEVENVCYPEEVKFTDKTTGGIKPYTYSWDFDGNGEEDSTDPNPVHSYSKWKWGTFYPELSITDGGDNEDSQTHEVIVYGPSHPKCGADPSYIFIEKQTVPAGAEQAFSFSSFHIDGTISDGESINLEVSPGRYTFTEEVPESWELTDITCSNASSTGNIESETATLIVEKGETVGCTFINSRLPTLTLLKEVINYDQGELGASDFPLFIDSSQVDSGETTILNPGDYVVSETQQEGYTTSDWTGDCDAEGNVTLDYGDEKICEITNSYMVQEIPDDGNGEELEPETYSITYDKNNAQATEAPVDGSDYEEGDEVAILGQGTMTLSGYTFEGWNTENDGSGTSYEEGDTFAMGSADVTLYAIWEKEATPSFRGGGFVPTQTEEEEEVEEEVAGVVDEKEEEPKVAGVTDIQTGALGDSGKSLQKIAGAYIYYFLKSQRSVIIALLFGVFFLGMITAEKLRLEVLKNS